MRVIYQFRHDGRKWRWWLESDPTVGGDGFDNSSAARAAAKEILAGKQINFWEIS